MACKSLPSANELTSACPSLDLQTGSPSGGDYGPEPQAVGTPLVPQGLCQLPSPLLPISERIALPGSQLVIFFGIAFWLPGLDYRFSLFLCCFFHLPPSWIAKNNTFPSR